MTDEQARRARARMHTAHLLDLLRGSAARSSVESLPTGAGVEEAKPVERRRRPLESPPTLPPVPAVPLRGRAVATVGESLRSSSGFAGYSGPLAAMVARARQFTQLSERFYAYLPSPLREHVVLVRLDAEAWELHTDAAVWATRLRYLLPSIEAPLGQQLELTLPKPIIRVRPQDFPPPVPTRPPLSLSQRSAEQLEHLAQQIDDPDLSAALRRLAARGRSDSASDS